MIDRDYYPAGAYNDANAPYNQMPDDYFDSEIEEHVDAEINSLDFCYLEWIDTIISINIEDDDVQKEVAKALAKDSKVRQAYFEHRYDEVYQDVIKANENY